MNKINQQVADAYNQHGRTYHESRTKSGRLFNEFLDMPATWSLMPENLSNLSILDAGCGSGIYAQQFAAKGANVTGIDISETMIAIANEENTHPDQVTYHIGDLTNMTCAAKSIDLIVCNYVLENIEDVKTIFAEFIRVLKPGGICIYSVSHPIRATANRIDSDHGEIWQLENYFDQGMRISDFGNGMKIPKYKRTVSDYINPAIEVGFSINRLYEPQPIAQGKEQDAKNYALAMRLPQLLVVKMIA